MPQTKPNEPLQLQLSLMEINAIIDALGQLPYARVFELIGKIHRQVRTQIESASSDSPTSTTPTP